jgi:hypothetical protein
MRQETGGWKWPAFSAALLLGISVGAGIAVYQAAVLAGLSPVQAF